MYQNTIQTKTNANINNTNVSSASGKLKHVKSFYGRTGRLVGYMAYSSPLFSKAETGNEKVWFTLRLLQADHPSIAHKNFVSIKDFIAPNQTDASIYNQLTLGTTLVVDYVVQTDIYVDKAGKQQITTFLRAKRTQICEAQPRHSMPACPSKNLFS